MKLAYIKRPYSKTIMLALNGFAVMLTLWTYRPMSKGNSIKEIKTR